MGKSKETPVGSGIPWAYFIGRNSSTDGSRRLIASGVLVAISIPIFTSQLEKSREAVDQANLRNAYAEVSADLLTEPKATDNANKTDKISEVTYKADATNGDTYTVTVTATQTDTAKWTSGTVSIGGKDVPAAASWKVEGNTKTGVVIISAEGTNSGTGSSTGAGTGTSGT